MQRGTIGRVDGRQSRHDRAAKVRTNCYFLPLSVSRYLSSAAMTKMIIIQKATYTVWLLQSQPPEAVWVRCQRLYTSGGHSA